MAKDGFIKKGHTLSKVSLSYKADDLEWEKRCDTHKYPKTTLHKHTLTVGGKVVSFEMI